MSKKSHNRAHDQKRRAEKPWRAWYKMKAWCGPGGRRLTQLAKVPWCEPCERDGKVSNATVANHLIPHRGDPYLFWHGALESVCKTCHDSKIQSAEAQGFRTDLDDDGWPVDPNHPFNRKR